MVEEASRVIKGYKKLQKLFLQPIVCPHCGGQSEVAIDTTADDQYLIEDCQQCCHPISLKLHIDHEHKKIQLVVKSNDD